MRPVDRSSLLAAIDRERQLWQVGILTEDRRRPYPGQRYKHGWIPVSPLASLHDEAEIRATYTFTDEPTGLSTEVTGINVGAGGQAYVYIQINDRDGNPVGEATRTILRSDQRAVRHDGMGIEPGFQGQGFATRFNARAEESYRTHGIERIELNANIDVGGYAWARAGYDFRDDNARAVALVHVATRAGSYSQAVRDEVNRAIRNPNITPIELAMIGYTPGATTWPGKEMMLGSNWDAVKKL